jgi:hypothetical protein
MTPDVPVDHAFAIERALRAYYASIDIPLIPCHEFSGRARGSAPVVWCTGSRLILPDFIRLDTWDAIEVKTQGYAPFLLRALARTTGVKRYQYEHYQAYETVTGRQVSLVFVHLAENEIRGGPLQTIQAAQTTRVNLRSDQVYWEYDQLPAVFQGLALSDVLAQALGSPMGRDGYTDADHAQVLAYLNTYATTNAAKHAAEWPTVVMD